MGAMEIITPGEESQTEEDNYRDVTYTREVKYGTKELIYPTEADSQIQKTNLCLPNRRRLGKRRIGSLALADTNCYIQDG